jgi:hypothetical protein
VLRCHLLRRPEAVARDEPVASTALVYRDHVVAALAHLADDDCCYHRPVSFAVPYTHTLISSGAIVKMFDGISPEKYHGGMSEKAGRGRPRLGPQETVKIEFLAPLDIRDRIRISVAEEGQSMGDWLREAVTVKLMARERRIKRQS